MSHHVMRAQRSPSTLLRTLVLKCNGFTLPNCHHIAMSLTWRYAPHFVCVRAVSVSSLGSTTDELCRRVIGRGRLLSESAGGQH